MTRYKVPLDKATIDALKIGDIIVEGKQAGRVIERNPKRGWVMIVPVRIFNINRTGAANAA